MEHAQQQEEKEIFVPLSVSRHRTQIEVGDLPTNFAKNFGYTHYYFEHTTEEQLVYTISTCICPAIESF